MMQPYEALEALSIASIQDPPRRVDRARWEALGVSEMEVHQGVLYVYPITDTDESRFRIQLTVETL